MDVAELGFEVNPVGINKGITALDKLDAAEERVGRTAQTSGGNIDKSYRSAAGGLNVATGAAGGLAAGFGNIKTAIGGLGVLALGKNALTMSSDFDAAMNNVQSKLLITTDAMRELRAQATELGSTTSFSASQAAEGMGFLAQAGLDATQIMGAMPNVLNLAAGASISLAESADIATNVMGGFGLEVEDLPRIMDLLAGASAKTNTSVQEMASAFVKSAPVVSEFGVSVNDAAAAVGIMADSGIKSERAGTVLLNMMTRLINPIGDGAKALEKYVITTEDLFRTLDNGQTEFVGFGAMMDLMASKGVDAADAMKIFGQEAGPGMLKILQQGSGGFQEYADKINITGAALLQAEIKMQGLPGSIKAMVSAWEGFNLALAAAGANNGAIAVIDGITGALRFLSTDGIQFITNGIASFKAAIRDFLNTGDGIGSLDAAMSGTNTTMASFATVMGPVVSALRSVGSVLSPLMPLLAPLAGYLAAAATAAAAFKATAAGITLVGGALAAVVKIGLSLTPLTASITAVAVGAVLLKDNWEGISAWWSDMWDGIKSRAQDFVGWLGTAFIDGLKATGNFVFDLVFPAVDELLAKGRALITSIRNWWNNVSLFEIDISFPSFDSLRSAGNDALDWALAPWKDEREIQQVAQNLPDTIESTILDSRSQMERAAQVIPDATISALRDSQPAIEREAKNILLTIGSGLYNTRTIRADAENAAELIGEAVGNGLEIGIRTSEGTVKATTEDLINLGVIQPAKNELESNSPSRVMIRIGEDAGAGLVIGLGNSAESLSAASARLASSMIPGVQGVVDALNAQYQAMDEADPIARRYGLAFAGVQIGNKEAANEILKLKLEQELQTIELTQGADAAERVRLALAGYSDEQIKVTMGIKETTDAMTEARASQEAFAKGFGDIFRNASNIKDVLRGIGDTARTWLQNLIGDFVEDEVLVMFGIGDTSGAENGASSFMGRLLNMFKDGFSKISGLFEGTGGFMEGLFNTFKSGFDKLKSLFSGGGGFMDGLIGAFKGGFDKLKGLLSGGDGGFFDGMINLFKGGFSKLTDTLSGGGGLLGTIKSLGSSFLGLGGSAGSAAAGASGFIASLKGIASAAGPAALVIGGAATLFSAFTAKWKTHAQGFRVAVEDGEIFGNSIEILKKKTLLFRNKYKTVLSEMDTDTFNMLTDYFTGMNTTITGQLTALGGDIESDILSAFNFESRDILNEEDLAEYFEDSTRQGYQIAFDRLGPQLQTMIGDSVDLATAPIGEIEAIFAGLGAVATNVVPMLDQLGITIGDSFDAQVVAATDLASAMGGSEQATEALTVLVNATVPAYQQAQNEISALTTQVNNWNAEIGNSSGSLITTSNSLATYAASLDTSTQAGTIAQQQIEAFTTSVDGAGGAVTLNQNALDVYRNTLDLSTQAGRDAAASVDSLTATFVQMETTSRLTGVQLTQISESIAASVGTTGRAAGVANTIIDKYTTGIDASTGAITLNTAGLQEHLTRLTGLRDRYTESATVATGLTSIIGGLNGQIGTAQIEAGTLQSRFGAVATTMTISRNEIQNVNQQLLAMGASGDQARQILRDFTVGIDGSTGALTLNTSGLAAYTRNLAGSAANYTQVEASIDAVNVALAQQGISLDQANIAQITTVQGLQDYIQAQADAANAGTLSVDVAQQNIAAALQQVDALQQLEAHYAQQAITLENVSTVARNLNLNFDATSPLAQSAADSLVELMGGLDAFSSATSSYYNTFFSDTERTQIELANSAAAVQAWTATLSSADAAAITSNETFRAYVSSLDLTTAAGQQAFASAIEVSSAFDAVTASGQTTQQIMDTLPANLEGAFLTMQSSANETAAVVTDTGVQIVASEAAAGQQRLAVVQQAETSIQATVQASGAAQVATAQQTDAAVIASTQSAASARVAAAQQAEQQVGTAIAGANQTLINGANVAAQAASTIESEFGAMSNRATGEAAAMNNGVVSEASVMNNLSGNAAQAMASTVVTNIRGMVFETQGYTRDWIGHIRGAFGIVTSIFSSVGSAARSMNNSTNSTTSAIRSLDSALRSVANSARNASSASFNVARINGSFSSGLGRVPFDGFIAETHKDEMILPASVANFFRESGIPTAQPTVSPVAANASVYRQDTSDNSALLEAIRRELEEIKRNNGAAADATERRLSDLTQRTAAQTKVLEDVEKDIDRLQRIPA